MKIKTINLEIEKLINNHKNVLFLKSNVSPFFTFDETTSLGYPLKYSCNDNYKYYLFLLGIKLFRCNKYHLNVVVYNKISNVVNRFEPFGNDNKSNSGNIKIFLIKQICNIFNLSKSPIYYDNIHLVLKHNNTNCALLCLKHLEFFTKDLEKIEGGIEGKLKYILETIQFNKS